MYKYTSLQNLWRNNKIISSLKTTKMNLHVREDLLYKGEISWATCDFKLVHILLIVSWIRLCTVNIVLLTFLHSR